MVVARKKRGGGVEGWCWHERGAVMTWESCSGDVGEERLQRGRVVKVA